MYWQKRFDRENPDKEVEEKILEIRKDHKDYGYRRILAELRNQGYVINKKKIQRIVQKLGLQVVSTLARAENIVLTKGRLVLLLRTGFAGVLIHMFLIRKITTDTSEFKYYGVDEKGRMTIHKLYLDPFMDMCTGVNCGSCNW